MANGDPRCPNCGGYLANLGPQHMMFCHIETRKSDTLFASTPTDKEAGEISELGPDDAEFGMSDHRARSASVTDAADLTASQVLRAHAQFGPFDLELLKKAMGKNWEDRFKHLCEPPTPPAHGEGELREKIEGDEGLRMDGYYIGFGKTGVVVIDRILSAIACAGKAYHNTECWTEETPAYEDVFRGKSPNDWIQCAANDAAELIRALSRTPSPPQEGRKK